MITEDLTKFKAEIKKNLDGRRLNLDGYLVLPEDDGVNMSDIQYDFIYSVYLTLLEGYATNVIKTPLYCLDEVKAFVKMPLTNVDRAYMVRFINRVSRYGSEFINQYYGNLEGTAWSFGDLAGAAMSLIDKF